MLKARLKLSWSGQGVRSKRRPFHHVRYVLNLMYNADALEKWHHARVSVESPTPGEALASVIELVLEHKDLAPCELGHAASYNGFAGQFIFRFWRQDFLWHVTGGKVQGELVGKRH